MLGGTTKKDLTESRHSGEQPIVHERLGTLANAKLLAGHAMYYAYGLNPLLIDPTINHEVKVPQPTAVNYPAEQHSTEQPNYNYQTQQSIERPVSVVTASQTANVAASQTVMSPVQGVPTSISAPEVVHYNVPDIMAKIDTLYTQEQMGRQL